MRYQIESDDLLILRDGRPFGEAGVVGGYSIAWPYPQTLAGMVRTTVGMHREPDYFEHSRSDFQQNLEDILSVGLRGILPMQRVEGTGNNWQPLLPAPADIVLTQAENATQLHVHSMTYETLGETEGTDIENPQWLYPKVDIKDKPAKEQPFFWHWNFCQPYIDSGFAKEQTATFNEIGIAAPVIDTRYHNALSRETGTTEEGRLFCNTGFYLKSCRTDEANKIVNELSVHFELTGTQALQPTQASLGGERKRVSINHSTMAFPEYPSCFENKRWLKLLLLTQGDFGDWCPAWLMPDLQAQQIDWVTIPDTDFKVRLRSACIKGWEPVSGWDIARQRPKAFRKLVKTGSVYLLEIQQPEQSADIARHFWGQAMSFDDPQSVRDGYSQCIVANAQVND